MKVVKGPIGADWESELTCSHCGAVLKVEVSDLRYEDQYSNYHSPYFYFTCPCCRNHTVVVLEKSVENIWRARQ